MRVSILLASLGRVRTAQGRYADAEPLLREALVGREKVMPNRWTRFEAQSLLGDSLVGQHTHADLLAGTISSAKLLEQVYARGRV